MPHDNHDWAAMADMLEYEGEADLSCVRQAVAELEHLAPRRVLDVGSGPGVTSSYLATVFPRAEVIAVDSSPELLDRAAHRDPRVRTRVAEFPDGLADLESADLVWSARTVHHVGDQQAALNQLSALLRPGGVLALVEGGLPVRWLPRDPGVGRPGLQERMDAAMSEGSNRMRAELPDTTTVVEDWSTLLRTAGLTDVRSKSFLVDHPAPLTDTMRQAVRHGLAHRREAFEEHLDAEDIAALDRLLDPADPAGVDQRTDLFWLAARTVHFGQRA